MREDLKGVKSWAMQTLAKKASNRAKSKFKGPQARVCPSYLRNSKEVSVAGVEKTREKNSGGGESKT